MGDDADYFKISHWNALDEDIKSQVYQALKGCKFANEVLTNRTTGEAMIGLSFEKISASGKVKFALPLNLQEKLKQLPETGMGYQIVDFIKSDGRVISNVTVLNGSEFYMLDEHIGFKDVIDVRAAKHDYLTWGQAQDMYNNHGKGHCLKFHCLTCGNIITCKCMTPKNLIIGKGCYNCKDKVEGNLKIMEAKTMDIKKLLLEGKSEEEIKKLMGESLHDQVARGEDPPHTIENLIKYLNESGVDVATRYGDYPAAQAKLKALLLEGKTLEEINAMIKADEFTKLMDTLKRDVDNVFDTLQQIGKINTENFIEELNVLIASATAVKEYLKNE
jgi:hypothetical protein